MPRIMGSITLFFTAHQVSWEQRLNNLSYGSVADPLRGISAQEQLNFFRSQTSLLDSLASSRIPGVLSPPTTPIKVSLDSNPFPAVPVDLTTVKKEADENVKVPKGPAFKSSPSDQKVKTGTDESFPDLPTSPPATTAETFERPSTEFLMTDDRTKRFGCPFSGCDYRSNRKNNLQRHKETMHHARAVAFSCCGLRFFRRAGN